MTLRKLTPWLVVLQLVLLVVLLVQVNGLSNQVASLGGEVADGGSAVVVPTGDAPSAPSPVDVTFEGDPYRGVAPDKAKVVIVEYSDFECPFCGRAFPTVEAILEKYDGDVSLIYKDYPLSFHPSAQPAAEAAECADEQGKFWEYHDLLFENQQALDAASLAQYAADVGLDVGEWQTCVDSGAMAAEVREDFAQGGADGVRGTPAFFVNGVLISGAQPQHVFEAEIEKHL